VGFLDYDTPEIKTIDHVCVMGDEKAAWFADSEGNILCLHERVIGDMDRCPGKSPPLPFRKRLLGLPRRRF
jgi:hypothetical protein